MADYRESESTVDCLLDHCSTIQPPPPDGEPPSSASEDENELFSRSPVFFGNQVFIPPSPPHEAPIYIARDQYYPEPIQPIEPTYNPDMLLTQNQYQWKNQQVTPQEQYPLPEVQMRRRPARSDTRTTPDVFSSHRNSEQPIECSSYSSQQSIHSRLSMRSPNQNRSASDVGDFEEKKSITAISEDHYAATVSPLSVHTTFSNNNTQNNENEKSKSDIMSHENTESDSDDSDSDTSISDTESDIDYTAALPKTPENETSAFQPPSLQIPSIEESNKADVFQSSGLFGSAPFEDSKITPPILKTNIGHEVNIKSSLKRSTRFNSKSLLYDYLKEIQKALITGEKVQIVTAVFSMIKCIKSNPQDIQYMKSKNLIFLLRQLLVHPQESVRVSERSDKFENERAEALKVIYKLILISPMLFPLSLFQSLLTIAGTPTDTLFIPSLKLLNYLLIKNEDLVCRHGGLEVLIEGAVCPQSHSIMSNILLTCLYIMNDYEYRSMTSIYAIQEIITPIINVTSNLPQNQMEAIARQNSNLPSAVSISTEALLLSLRTWSGIFAFCSGREGLNSIINMISPMTEKNTLITILKMLFRLIGLNPPNPDSDDIVSSPIRDTTIYWTSCSIYLSSVTNYIDNPLYSPKPIFNDNTNIVSIYLAFILWVLTKSKLTEYISETIKTTDKDILFYVNHLYKEISILNSLLIPGCETANLLAKTVDPAEDAFSFENNVTETQLKNIYKARDFLSKAGVEPSVLYLTCERNPFIYRDCSNLFGNINIIICLLDYLNGSDNVIYKNDGSIKADSIHDYFIQKDIPYQSISIQQAPLFPLEAAKYLQLIKLSKVVHNSLGASWNWKIINTILYKSLINEKFVYEIFRNQFVNRIEQFFRCAQTDKPTLVFYPILESNYTCLTCYILWLILLLRNNYAFITVQRRLHIFTDYTRCLTLLIHGYKVEMPRRSSSSSNNIKEAITAPDYLFGGIFTQLAMQMTYSYFYFYSIIRLLSSSYVYNFLLETKFFNLIDLLTTHNNPRLYYILRIIISSLDPVDNSSIQRKKFTDIMNYCFASNTVKTSLAIFCLCRLKSIFRERVLTQEFIQWCVPLITGHLSVSSSISALCIDILYENCTNHLFLKCLIENKPQLSRLKNADLLIYRIITEKEGFELVQSQQQFCSTMLDNFLESGIFEYVGNIDSQTMTGICHNRPSDPTTPINEDEFFAHETLHTPMGDYNNNNNNGTSYFPGNISIPQNTNSMNGASLGGNGRTNRNDSLFELNTSIKDPTTSLQTPLYNTNIYLKGGRRSLEWIFSVPWSIHGKIVDSTSYPPIVYKYIDFDVYPDISIINIDGQDELRITGISIDYNSGLNKALPLYSKFSIYTCLFIGSMYVTKSGDLIEIEGVSNKLEQLQSNNVDRPYNTLLQLREYICNNVPLECWSLCGFADVEAALNSREQQEEKDIFKVKPTTSKCIFKFHVPQNAFLTEDPKRGKPYYLHSVDFKIDLFPKRPATINVPPHLFGALAYTDEGRKLLLSRVKLNQYDEVLRDTNRPALQRRAILWSFTNIALSPNGCDFLDKNISHPFLDTIFCIAEQDICLSLKGTALTCISILSQVPAISRYAAKRDWMTVKNAPIPLCLPLKLEKFLQLPVSNALEPSFCSHYLSSIPDNRGNENEDATISQPKFSEEISGTSLVNTKSKLMRSESGMSFDLYSAFDNAVNTNIDENNIKMDPSLEFANSSISGAMTNAASSLLDNDECDSDLKLLPPLKPVYRDIIEQISKLVNNVKGKDMLIKLIDLKTKNPELFQDPILLLHVHHFFSIFPLPRTPRKFIFQLFGNMIFTKDTWKQIDINIIDPYNTMFAESSPILEKEEDDDYVSNPGEVPPNLLVDPLYAGDTSYSEEHKNENLDDDDEVDDDDLEDIQTVYTYDENIVSPVQTDDLSRDINIISPVNALPPQRINQSRSMYNVHDANYINESIPSQYHVMNTRYNSVSSINRDYPVNSQMSNIPFPPQYENRYNNMNASYTNRDTIDINTNYINRDNKDINM
ncbi:hypothetical protein WA158_000915 [Blastocystis sp. Blastoise]